MLLHTPSKTQIFYTKDYSIFSKILGNRDLNATKIKKIKADIENGLDILRYCPILVAEKDGKLDIIDGQHRFNVSRLLKTFVWYVLADELTLSEIARINSNQEKWKNKDFVKCYAEGGNENYIELQKFIDKYNFSVSLSLQMLTLSHGVSNGGGKLMHLFQEGKFKIENKENAYVLADAVKLFSEFPSHSSHVFVTAISKVVSAGNIKISDLADAYNKNREKLHQQRSWKDYIVNLETIINIGKHKRVIIY